MFRPGPIYAPAQTLLAFDATVKNAALWERPHAGSVYTVTLCSCGFYSFLWRSSLCAGEIATFGSPLKE